MKNNIAISFTIAALCLAATAVSSCKSEQKTEEAKQKVTGVTIKAATSKDVEQIEVFTG